MQIFDHEPANWSALQEMVGRLFEELGCEVAIGMRVETSGEPRKSMSTSVM
jgi:hypothetical protein